LHGFVCSLQAYIREQIVQTIAVIHKRSMLDRDQATQCSEDALFTDIARLIHTGSQSSVSKWQANECCLLAGVFQFVPDRPALEN